MATLGACASQHAGQAGRSAPLARFFLFNGGELSTPELRGRGVVLIFWRSSCPHCRRALPEINELLEGLPKNERPLSIAVSIDPASLESEVQDFIKEHRLLAMQHAFSGNGVYDEAFMAFDPPAVPYLYVLDAAGVIIMEGSSPGVISEVWK